MPFIAPGAKIGLANVITMLAIMTLNYKETFLIVLTRVTLGSIFGGGLSGFLYSMSGGILSLIAMAIIIEVFREKVSPIGISVTGAVFHNVGQLIIAISILRTTRLILYLPVLTIVACISGVFIGYVAKYLLEHFNTIIKDFN
jgi:heptaprenyl diphosphate synthase